MSHHYIVRCRCGVVLGQCHCADATTAEALVQDGCLACWRAKKQEVQS